MNRLLAMVAVLLASVWGVRGLAQSSTAALRGRVADPTGLSVAGANVEAENVSTNGAYPTVTNESGQFSLPSLPPGTYRIKVAKEGFQSVLRSDVELHVASTVELNFDLKVGAVANVVEVTSESPLVNVATSSLSGLVESNEIQDLPLNGRNYIGLTLLQPGVVVSPNTSTTSLGAYHGTWYSSNGAPPRTNNFSLDGAVVQDMTGSSSNYIGRTLGLDGIQEFRVVTNSPSAEYGLGLGSQTVMVSKSGGNGFHGGVFEYLRNNVLDAANYFDVPTAANNFARLPKFQRNNFGASAGGPIRKDKTFFFATFEAVRERQGQTIIDNVLGAGCHGNAGATITNTACPQLGTTASVTIAPVVAPLLALFPNPNLPANTWTAPFTQPDSDNYGQIRIDHIFSPKDSTFGRYTIDQDDNQFAGAYPQYLQTTHSGRHQYLTVSENHIFSPTWLNTARFSLSRTSDPIASPNSLVGAQYSFAPGLAPGQISVGGVTALVPSGQFTAQSQNVLSLSDDIMATVGAHTLKFGAQINSWRQYSANALSNRQRGLVTFGSVTTFLQGLPTNYSLQSPAIFDRTLQFYNMGFYLQDDWKVRRNLTINAGLRYEPTANYLHVPNDLSSSLRNLSDPSFTVGPLAKNPTMLNFTPRLGLAWDVMGNGKTAVRAGAALLSDLNDMNFSVFMNVLSVQPPFSGTSTQSNVTSFVLPLAFPSAVASKSVGTVDYNIKQGRLFTTNFSIEQQLPFSMVLMASYAYSRGMHLFGTHEANPNIPSAFVNGLPVWPLSGTVRFNPNFADTLYVCGCADSTFNALQVMLSKRLTKGLQFQNSFTWSKTIDDAQGSRGDSVSSSAYPTDPFSNSLDRGVSSFNIPLVWTTNVIYALPSPRIQMPVISTLTSGWTVTGILTFRDGLPFNPGDVTARSNSGVAGGSTGQGPLDRPNWNPTFTGSVITGNPNQWYNPAAFVLQPAGTLGNVSRNSLQGPGYQQIDLALQKNTKLRILGEAGSLEFRAEAYNIFNHPNLGMPDNGVFAGALTDPVTALPLATAGRITKTLGTSRQLEFALRVKF